MQKEINIHSLWQHTDFIRNSYVNKKTKQIFCGSIYSAATTTNFIVWETAIAVQRRSLGICLEGLLKTGKNCIKIVQRPGRNSQRTPSEFICTVLLLHLPYSYAELCYRTYRIHMQNFTTTPTEYVCRALLLHLPYTYADFYYQTYRICMQSFTTTSTEYICKTLLPHLPNTYAEICCYTYLLGKAMSIIVFK